MQEVMSGKGVVSLRQVSDDGVSGEDFIRGHVL